MSTVALKSAFDAAPTGASGPKLGVFQRLIRMREREALRQILAFLASKSDERLADMGYTAEDIEALRRGKLHFPS
jgi:hypothetical protein